MELRVVHKPSAGSGAIDRHTLVDALETAGHEVVGYHSVDDDWRAHIGVGELLVVAGGDGTVGAVIIDALGKAGRVGIVPTGTANNVARSLGIDVERPLSVPAAWTAGAPVVHLDIPTVHGADGACPFVEAVGGGVFAELIRSADRREEQGLEPEVWSTLAEVVDESDAGQWAIVVDGADLSGRYLAVHAANIPFTGPNIPVAPTARADDGRLDLVLVTPADRAEFLDYALRRGEDAVGVTPPSFKTVSGRHITMEPPDGCALSVDDTNRERDCFADPTIRIEGAGATMAVLAAQAAHER